VDRVFVSDGNVLLRRRSSGAGSNGGPPGPALYSFSFENGDMQLALLLATEMGRATAMGLGPAGTKGFIGDPGAVTTELTVEDPKVLSDFTLKNLNGDVTIELVGDVADGSEIVVTRPTDDWSYEDFRLFSGSGGSLAERRVINTVRTKNGDTIIEFESENGVATASFTWVFDPNTMSHPGPGNIRGAGPEQTMAQRFPTPTTLPGTSFSCLR
jgi:hypothetical protein